MNSRRLLAKLSGHDRLRENPGLGQTTCRCNLRVVSLYSADRGMKEYSLACFGSPHSVQKHPTPCQLSVFCTVCNYTRNNEPLIPSRLVPFCVFISRYCTHGTLPSCVPFQVLSRDTRCWCANKTSKTGSTATLEPVDAIAQILNSTAGTCAEKQCPFCWEEEGSHAYHICTVRST